jgi:heterodisulfide reductase subunit C
MDRSPRAVINLIRAGFKKEVLEGNTHWICSSCYSCGIECPQQIHVTDIMYALKRVAIREGTYPKRLPAAVLAKEFTKMAVRRGRVNEAWLVVQMNLRTSWLNFLKMARLGLELVRTGRIALNPESIKNRQQLATITQSKEPAKGGRVS